MDIFERYLMFERIFSMDTKVKLYRNPEDLSNPLNEDATYFQKRFRLSKDTFCQLVTELNLRNNFSQTGSPLPFEIELLAVLRYFATGSFQITMGDLFKISQSTMSVLIKKYAMKIASMRNIYIKFPNEDEFPIIKKKFFDISGFPGCIGAIDCTHVWIINPGGENGEIFRNRKGFFSMNCQVLVNSDYEITSANVMWPGSTHDSRIFDNSVLKTQLENVNGAHVLGDSGYPLRRYLMTPFQIPDSVGRNKYNKAHSSTRMRVECTFGIVKRRFQCLQTKLNTKLITSINTIIACFVLHNFCIKHNDIWKGNVDIEIEEIFNVRRELNDSLQGSLKREYIVDNFFS